jgi:hypothetical protein
MTKIDIILSVILLVFTSLFVGKVTFEPKPFVFVLERPYLALSTFLFMSGAIVFIYFAVPRELLNK